MALNLAAPPTTEQLPIMADAESSGGKNVWGPETSSGQAEGYYQITTGTWKDFAPKAGVDLSQYPDANSAPKEVQEKVAQVIPLGRWDPRTLAKLPGGNAADAASALNIGGDFQNFRAMLGTPNSSWLAPTMTAMRADLAAQRAELGGINRQTEADYAADRQRARTAYDAASKDDTTPWNKPPPPRDALEGFASAGSIFAAIASAFTRTPAISAMNGMAAAINARRDGDQKAYDDAYKVWQDNTKLAIDRQKMASDRLSQALQMMSTDVAHGTALARQVMTEHGDERGLLMLEAGEYQKLDEARLSRDRTAAQLAIQASRLGAYGGMTMSREQAMAVEDYLRQHPGASRLDAIKAVTEVSKAGAADKTGPAYYNRKINEANAQLAASGKPPLTPEQEGNLRATLGGKRALSEKDLDNIEIHASTENEALTKLQNIDEIMARTSAVAGAANKVLGPGESISNLLDFSSDTDRRDFQKDEAWLKINAPVLLKHANPTSRTIASDEKLVDQIIKGGNWGDTYYNVQSSIKDLRRMFTNDLALLQQQTKRGTGSELSLPGQTLPGQAPALTAPAAPAAQPWLTDPDAE